MVTFNRIILIAIASFCSLTFFAQDVAMLADDMMNEVSFDLDRKEGVVTLSYASKVPQDIELIFLTQSGSVLWSKVLYDFSGKASEKLDYLVPEGTYVTRVLNGSNELTKRIKFKQ